jgi:ABC-type branched-subunit amino acid transport system substrate-binding protein
MAVVRALACAALVFSWNAASAQFVIKVAVGAPLTGPLAKQGQQVANAVTLAADAWNARGGVLGRKFQLLDADDQGNPQIGVAAAEKVAADTAVWGITSAIRATKGYQGILGAPITFDDKGDATGGLIFIYQIYQVKGLGFEQIKTIVVK